MYNSSTCPLLTQTIIILQRQHTAAHIGKFYSPAEAFTKPYTEHAMTARAKKEVSGTD